MKLSLQFQDHQQQNPQPNLHNHHENNPFLLRAKVPISVFGLPFLSGVAATDFRDPSLSLRTNFSSGPALKLSYTPTSAATANGGATGPPFMLTLKSGVSLFGSPQNSPLIISANFTLSPQNPNPTFSIQFKPQFGDFSLSKTIHSPSNSDSKANGVGDSFTFVPLERPIWKDMKLDSCSGKSSLLSGIAVRARTAFQVTKGVAVNFRWGVNLPADFGKQLPFLSVNKIRIERVEEAKEVKLKNSEGSLSDVEVLKSLCFWMGRELDVLQRENGDIKRTLEEMKTGNSVSSYRGESDGVGKMALPPVENSGGFEQWRSKKGRGEGNMQKEVKKSVNGASKVESELEKAIRAASS